MQAVAMAMQRAVQQLKVVVKEGVVRMERIARE
jgi:hypothetical protein